MKVFLFLSIFLSFIHLNVFAGGSTAGGNVMICVDPISQIETIEVLDYYEAKILHLDLKINLGPATDVLGKINHALNRLALFDRETAKEYREQAADFFNHVTWIAKGPLATIPDFGYVPVQPHCRIEQTIHQKHGVTHGAIRGSEYIINKSIWDRLGVEDRAGLILHEIIYSEALDRGHKNSMNARYLNALLSSENVEKFSQSEFSDQMQDLGFGEGCVAVPPRWVQSNLNLDIAYAGENYVYDFSKWVQHPLGYKIDYELVQAPSWVHLNEHQIEANPVEANEGLYTFKIRAKENIKFSHKDITVSLWVVKKRGTFIANAFWNLGQFKARTKIDVQLSQTTQLASSADIQYKAVNLPKWIKLDSSGRLQAVPGYDDRGYFRFTVDLIVKKFKAQTLVFSGNVVDGYVPIFAMNPIQMNAKVGTAFRFDLSGYVANLDKVQISFRLGAGCSWMSIDSRGILTGTPSKNDVGTHKLEAVVTDSKGNEHRADLLVKVSP